MINENGIEMSEEDLLNKSLKLMGEVCCLLFETNNDESKAAAYMADNLLKYLQVIYNEDDILMAACDYEEYEMGLYKKKKLFKQS